MYATFFMYLCKLHAACCICFKLTLIQIIVKRVKILNQLTDRVMDFCIDLEDHY